MLNISLQIFYIIYNKKGKHYKDIRSKTTKYIQVAEKNVLPSAEDLKAEKTHENLQKGIEGFTPDKLKSVKTKEPATGADCK